MDVCLTRVDRLIRPNAELKQVWNQFNETCNKSSPVLWRINLFFCEMTNVFNLAYNEVKMQDEAIKFRRGSEMAERLFKADFLVKSS